jgi:predicted nucleic acid-binding protein
MLPDEFPFTKVCMLAVGKEKVPGALPDDLQDEKFPECALEGQADVIVSGDHHLLTLKFFHGIPMVTARQFVEQYLS